MTVDLIQASNFLLFVLPKIIFWLVLGGLRITIPVYLTWPFSLIISGVVGSSGERQGLWAALVPIIHHLYVSSYSHFYTRTGAHVPYILGVSVGCRSTDRILERKTKRTVTPKKKETGLHWGEAWLRRIRMDPFSEEEPMDKVNKAGNNNEIGYNSSFA